MMLRHTAAIGFLIAITPVLAIGQQRNAQGDPRPSASAGGVTETTVITMPGIEGRLRPWRESTTETIRSEDGTSRVRRDTFGFGVSGPRVLLERSESEQAIQPDGTVRTVQSVWVPDLNGRLNLTQRQVELTTSPAADVTQTDVSISRPGIEGILLEVERIQETERQPEPGVVHRETSMFVRDVNGRFQLMETRSEIRSGPDGRSR